MIEPIIQRDNCQLNNRELLRNQQENQIQNDNIYQTAIIIKSLMQAKHPQLHDWQVLENVAPYLSISDLLKTSTLSKEFNFSLRNYLKKHVLPSNTITNNNNELSMAKKVFHRQLKVCSIDGEPSVKNINPKLILKNVQIGTNFGHSYTLFETIQNDRVVIDNNEIFLNSEFKNYIVLDKSMNGKFVNIIGDSLYVCNDTQLSKYNIRKDNQGAILFKQQQKESIQFEHEIVGFKHSQTHIFIITKNSFDENSLFAVNFKIFKPVEICFEIHEQHKHINQHLLTVGDQAAYYIINFKAYELSLQKFQKPKLVKSLKDKDIRKIINGNRHYFAIERKDKITEEWDNSQVIEWALKEGFEDYTKIFKIEKVTGKTLLNMDKRYMEDVLGLLNHKLQQRLQIMLEENNKEKQENCVIYGWGRNEKSQLGINPSNPVSNPYKVKLPQGFNFLKCQNNTTLIHNSKKGEICCNSVNSQGKAEWKTLFTQVYNVWAVSVSRDSVIVLCPIQKDHISQNLSEVPIHHKKEKLRTAKNIIDKIQWDEHIDKKDFRVGYFDKYSGILEVSFEELLITADIKQYRIEYFKRGGEVVWSKKDRIDIL